jgi:hypothetical protein
LISNEQAGRNGLARVSRLQNQPTLEHTLHPDYYQQFAPIIKSLSHSDLRDGQVLRSRLRIAAQADVEVCYAPLEYVNPRAKVVIVGITPGLTQMVNSVVKLRTQLDAGMDRASCLRSAKTTGAFSGAMRPNLIDLLDAVGLQSVLRISTCASLFGDAADLVQTTSVLRNPVFLRGGNYNGTPSMLKTPLLRAQLLDHFGQDVRHWNDAIFVPLGDRPAEALGFLTDEGLLARAQILDGLPHPSGAIGERIAYFLGKKARTALSSKTNPAKLDRARQRLRGQAAMLRIAA